MFPRVFTVSNTVKMQPKMTLVPPSTDVRIEKIIARIRALCSNPFTPMAEAELKKLARELRLAINQHVQMAKGSLTASKVAIQELEPEEE